jgi:hypothetical protein
MQRKEIGIRGYLEAASEPTGSAAEKTRYHCRAPFLPILVTGS